MRTQSSHPGETNLNKEGSLGQEIFDIAGNPAYCDTMEEYTRLKWSQPFTGGQVLKMKNMLEHYSDYLVEFDAEFVQKRKATTPATVIKLLVHPNIVQKVKKINRQV